MTELQKYRLGKLAEISTDARKLNNELKSFPKTLPELKQFIKETESAYRREINLDDEKELRRQMELRKGLFKNKLNDIIEQFDKQQKNILSDLADFENRDLITKINDQENESQLKEIHNLTIGEVTKIQTLINETKNLIND